MQKQFFEKSSIFFLYYHLKFWQSRPNLFLDMTDALQFFNFYIGVHIYNGWMTCYPRRLINLYSEVYIFLNK